MFIEFAGMIGAGKSTLRDPLERILEEKGLRPLSLREAITLSLERAPVIGGLARALPTSIRSLILYRFYLVALCPFQGVSLAFADFRVCRQIVASQVRRRIPLRHRAFILRRVFDLMLGRRFLRGRLEPGEVVVLEEGLLQRAVNLYAWEPDHLDQGVVRRYFTSLRDGTRLVLVRAPLEICMERIRERGLPIRARTRDPVTVERFLRNAELIIGWLREFVVECRYPVVEVHNASDLDTAVSQLRKGFEGLIPAEGLVGSGVSGWSGER